MEMETDIRKLLEKIFHPESGVNIVEAGIVESVKAAEDKINVTLAFAKSRDPFAAKIKRQVQESVAEAFPKAAVTVTIREAAPRQTAPQQQTYTTTSQIRHTVAVASGKGGVGKSTVTANLAVALRKAGYRVGVLDADIYGPSQPRMFGAEGYVPDAVEDENGHTLIVPAVAENGAAAGIEVMSIGFFIKPTDALMWRGAMAVNALKQMIHQTAWGELDYLLIDLPPGTGDIHLSIIGELRIDAAVIVSTPQQIAVADVVRGVEMFRHPQVGVPVAGIVENMAWFTPAELPDNRYYIFGRGGAERYARENGIDLLGKIPLIQSVMECSEDGYPAAGVDERVAEHYREIADKIVDKLSKGC